MISEKILEQWDLSGAPDGDKLEALSHRLKMFDLETSNAGEELLSVVRPGCDTDPADMDLSELIAEAGKQMQRLRLEIETLKNNYDVQVQEGEELRQKLEALQRTVPTDPAYPTLPTYDAGAYQVRIGSLYVMRPNDKIYSEMTTTVTIIDDEGESVEVEQVGQTSVSKIIIYPFEWPALATAINLLIAQCRSDK